MLLCNTSSSFTCRYFEVGGELLTSVQRTEESLLKLKSYRKSLVPTLSLVGGGMTDDNKIRLQLALDIEEFTMQVYYNCNIYRYSGCKNEVKISD